MFFDRFLALFVSSALLACLPAHASHLVTGNGFGFAVVSPENAAVTKFYAHPYSFGRPDAKNPLSEGVETANFIKAITWSGKSGQTRRLRAHRQGTKKIRRSFMPTEAMARDFSLCPSVFGKQLLS
jgi:hypothetical protein